jgi:hypothetical protein
MNTKIIPSTAAKPKSDHAQARSAEALRANLLKRKAQARARASTDDETAPTLPKDDTPS